ncbi:MAG: hypothetical protein M0R21_01915 [Lentimicrobiaceae bacterium]|nr:hypothetical protein [Lentimicrobiaceae bacterium]
MHVQPASNPVSFIRWFFTAVLFFILIHPTATAQFYNGSQLNFGRNRVQYNDFFWTYYRFDKFDTYFYLNGRELAVFTAKYAKAILPELEKKLEATLEGKLQFIIYNSLSDLKQSNIGFISNQQYNTGGVTHIIGKKIFLFFDGSHVGLQKQIRAGISKILLENAVYGGNIGSQLKNSTLFNLPDWYVNGLVSYISEDWNTDIDNHVREIFATGKYKHFNQLVSSGEALYAGHSIWKFIAERYGETVIPGIIYASRINKGIESGFNVMLGLSLKEMVREWKHFYLLKYNLPDSLQQQPAGEKLIKKPKSSLVFARPKISPDGTLIVYTTNELGRYTIWLKDVTSGKARRIFKRGYALDEKVDYSFPLLAWHPSGKLLAFIIEAKGQLWLYFYTPENRKLIKQGLFGFQKVLDFSYSPDGKTFVFSAQQRGQSDIFIYNIAANSYQNITQDIFDDLNPAYISNGREIVFSSNRDNDTLKGNNNFLPASLSSNFDLFVYNPAATDKLLHRITETTLAVETQPMEYAPGFITYLSDENGINNRYLARFDSAITYVDTVTHYKYFAIKYPITNYTHNIIYQDVNIASGMLSEVVRSNGRYYIYYHNRLLPSQMPENMPLTLNATPYMQQKQAEAKKTAEKTKKEPKKTNGKKRKRFVNVYVKDVPTPPTDTTLQRKEIPVSTRQNFIRINDDGGDTLWLPQKLPDEPAVFTPPRADTNRFKQRNYNVEYSVNELITQVDFNFLNYTYQPFTGGGGPVYMNPGTNALLKVGITDLLEDFRITGGVRLNYNLINNEYLLSIANARGRLDKELVFHRQTLEEDNGYSVIRHHTHEIFHILTYPLDQALSLKGTFLYRNDQMVYLSTDYYNLRKKNIYQNWGGLKGELIFDATRDVGLNLYYGTRYKIFAEYYQLVDGKQKNMIVLGLDFRNYKKIHRTLIWANRFAASTSLGNSKLMYYLGGVDNWLAPGFMNQTPIDYSQNYTFQTLATNMRGFNQNIRNGNSFAIINSELRLPVFRYFLNRPLRSDFLTNFQIIAFGDVGTAWTGFSPYSDDNFLYTRIIYNGPMKITVKQKKEPIVAAYGLGLRSKIFGYFVRADYGWGIEDKKVNKGYFYLSLNLDF